MTTTPTFDTLTVNGTVTLVGPFTGNPTFSGNPTFNTMSVSGNAGTARQITFQTAGSNRFVVGANSGAETGLNAGSQYQIGAYNDSGSFIGNLAVGNRASGPYGTGLPRWQSFAPFTQSAPRAAAPGGVLGNDREWGATADQQPSATLGANPISTTNGSAIVNVTWANCTAAGGPISSSIDSWVNISGATAVGGITLSGWYDATVVDTNTFSVNAGTPANATTTGGGSAVVVRPSSITIGDKTFIVMTTGAVGFPVGTEDLYAANPEFYQTSTPAQYEQHFAMICSPPDSSQTHAFTTIHRETDLINRASDEGYHPNLYAAPRPTIGFWIGPWPTVPGFFPGGGTCKNWNTVYSIFTQHGAVGVYDGYSIQPNALVGASNDPTGHGGVGADFFGAYTTLGSNPFATSNGTSTVTVTVSVSAIAAQANGGSVYIPSSYTINNVTFGAGSYTMSNVNTSTGTFTITGTGTANASGSGGGSSQYLYFLNLVPYAPVQWWGRWKHGIITDSSAFFESGGLIETQPGNGYLWNDGTGTASINATKITAGNIDVTVTPAGTGQVRVNGSSSWTANGSVATALSSVGPTGSHTTVQEWFTVKNASGTVRYIPAF